ncbi:MAG: type II secretion system F family protein [Cetobacterium sp.]
MKIFNKIKEKDLKNFYLKTGRLLNAGISLKKAIEFQKNNSKNNIFKSKILNIYNRLDKGEDIYSSLKKEEFIKERELLIIYVFENNGKIGDGFLKVAYLKEKKEKLNNEIKIALSYPIFILIVSSLIIVLIFYFVVPNFEEVYSIDEKNLPLLTKIILKIKYLISEYIFLLFLTVPFFLLSIKSKLLKKLLYKVSIIKKFLIEKHIVSILDSLATLLESGISIDKGIEIILDNLDSGFLKNKIYILKNIKKGESLSNCFNRLNLFDLEEIDMIKIGEESGTVEFILKEIAATREEELNRKLKIVLKLVEPILLLIVGVFISIFVIGLYLPILNMSDLLEL